MKKIKLLEASSVLVLFLLFAVGFFAGFITLRTGFLMFFLRKRRLKK